MAEHRLHLVESRSQSVPEARSGHRCVTDGIFLYCYGGYNPNYTTRLFYEKIWCFHLSTKTWNNIVTTSGSFHSVPKCVASSVLLLHKGEFVVVGGSGYPFGSQNSNASYTCDPLKQRWYRLTLESGGPTEGYGQGGVIGPDNCMYVFGGTKGLVYNNDLHKYDFDDKRWELIECNDAPSARYRHEMVGIKEGFIVLGGYGPYGACSLAKIPVYSYGRFSWSEVQSNEDPDHGFPEPRRAHSCIKYEDNVYICGGYGEEPPANVFNDIWKLNVLTFTWSKLPQILPHPTYFHSAAVTSEGCMYIFGGIEQINEEEDRRTNYVSKMWLAIPSLERLCWEELCNTIPSNRKLDTEKLSELGIPKYLLASYKAQFMIGLYNDNFK